MSNYSGKPNHTTTMRVVGSREDWNDKDLIVVEFETPRPKPKKKGKPGEPVPMPGPDSRCSIGMSKEEAAHYPVGSEAEIHCVPKGGGGGEKKDRLYPKGLRGKMARASEASAKARKGYREDEEADED